VNEYALSDDRRTLVVKRHLPEGVLTATYHSQRDAGFTDDDVSLALSSTPAASRGMKQPGQRNRSRRTVTRFGTLWTHVSMGPPTWWKPQARREGDGTLMAGWLRLAVAVRFDLPARSGATGTPREDG
jgi:hypothetical protein